MKLQVGRLNTEHAKIDYRLLVSMLGESYVYDSFKEL